MGEFIKTRIIGIVDNTLYIDGLYAGDHLHDSIISDWTKSDLINRDVKVFSSRRELDAYYDEIFFIEMMGS